MVSMLPFLTNVITISSMARLTFLYSSLLSPKYVCEVSDYSKADVQNIKKPIKDFNRGKALESLSIDSKVDLLNKTFSRTKFRIKKLKVSASMND